MDPCGHLYVNQVCLLNRVRGAAEHWHRAVRCPCALFTSNHLFLTHSIFIHIIILVALDASDNLVTETQAAASIAG